MFMELNLNYVHGSAIGYGRYGVNLAKSLKELGVNVYDDLPGPDRTLYEEDERDPSDRSSKKCNVVCWVSVPTHARGWYKSQYSVISTMWEAMHLPEQFRENLHNFDLVIVPSHQNLELFSKYHDNVKLVPLGIDPKDWYYTPRKPPTSDFRFLIGGSGERKGTDLAFKAFKKLWGKEGSWGDGPIPRLIMKNPKGERFYSERVEIIGGRLSAEAEIALYENSHCYIQPSRGEGFGLQPLQALAQGMPTILTAAHGHDSFAHLGYGISATPQKSGYFIYGDAGDWWEPNFDELCERMEFVYNNYATACGHAQVAADAIAEQFTWEQTATKFIDVIGPQRLTTPFTESEWIVPDNKLFKVITLKDWDTDIAGTVYHFKKGKEYWEMADVKRILFEAGLLDPACIEAMDDQDNFRDFEHSLTEKQLERVESYSAAHEHCPTCGQKLNTKPTRSDELLEKMSKV